MTDFIPENRVEIYADVTPQQFGDIERSIIWNLLAVSAESNHDTSVLRELKDAPQFSTTSPYFPSPVKLVRPDEYRSGRIENMQATVRTIRRLNR